MKSGKTVLICLLVLSVCMSCRLIDTLEGNDSAGTVENLWPDVPPMDGATKSNVAIPLGARLAIRGMMQGKVNFISFTTDKSAEDVKNFYSNERMKAAGWTPNEKGCIGDTDDKASQGAVCFFTRKDSSKEEGLAIVLGQDEKTKQTDIFYARIDMTPDKTAVVTATPTP